MTLDVVILVHTVKAVTRRNIYNLEYKVRC